MKANDELDIKQRDDVTSTGIFVFDCVTFRVPLIAFIATVDDTLT